MSEFITMQIGQCGNQIGSSFWPLILHEYGIKTNCSGVNTLKIHKNYYKNMKDLSDAFNSFFYVPQQKKELAFKQLSDLVTAKVKARAILIDMEDSVVSRYKHWQLQFLFDQKCSITNYPGSGNNWAVGYYTHGLRYYDIIEETVRHTVEKCDSLHGFLLLHSLGGGTGSGLGTAILKLLNDNYPHVDRFVSCVYPGGTQDVITAPYNTLLATHELIEHATCVFPAENGALQEICNTLHKTENINQAVYNTSCKSFQDMNSLIVNTLLHLTSGARFPGSLNTDMNELTTNLVPYPKLHYICSSVSPVALTSPIISTSCNSKYYDELFTKAWSRNNQLIKVDPLKPGSVIIGAAHIIRGNPSLSDVKRNIERFQKKAKCTTWSKGNTKVGICSIPPAGHPASLISLLNSSSMSSIFTDIGYKFNKLFKKKAHIHHYLQVENFEEELFHESKECIANILTLYKELQSQTPVNISRLHVL